jgi:hypothetical protein
MAAVTMPDGAVVEMPDQLDPALGARLRAFHDAHAPRPAATFGNTLLGEGELGGAALANIIPGGINALNELANRATGQGGKPAPLPTVPVGEAGRNLISNVKGLFPGTANGLDISDEELRQLDPSGKTPIEELRKRYAPEAAKSTEQLIADTGTPLGDVASSAMHVANLGAQIAPGAALAGKAAGLVEGIPSTLGPPAPITDIENQLSAVGFKNLPSKSGGGLAARAGEDVVGTGPLAAHQTLTNQAVMDRLAKSAAGVSPDEDLSYASIAKARAQGPAKVYDAARQALPPTLIQTPELRGALASIGDTTSQLPKSPDVDALKQTMLSQPEMTRDQLFANIQQARDRASRFYASDQPDAHAIGDAYQGVANAYEDFVGKQLESNPRSPVSLQDWQDARTAFAKNYAVQSALQGTSVKGSTLARLQRQDPGRLTGELQLIAEQANRYPLSSGFGPATTPDSGVGASGTPGGAIARHITGPILGGSLGTAIGGPVGGAIGTGTGLLGSMAVQNILRRVLGGNPVRAAEVAGRALQDPRLADLFDPPEPEEPLPGPLELTPPPGTAFEPHQPQLATGAPTQRDFFGTGANHFNLNQQPPAPVNAHPGDISLHDLLAHGVEQSPPPELTAGPMGAPAQEGIPFQRNADFESGGLETHEPDLNSLLENLKDHPAVMSQGVPEGIMAKTGPIPSPEPAEGGGFVFRSPNGQTIARKRGDALQISASLTKQTAQGAGEGTQRLIDAYNFARANGLRLVSDTKVSNAAAKMYDRLEKQGFEITRNPHEPDGKGNILSTSGRPIFEVQGPSDLTSQLLAGSGG